MSNTIKTQDLEKSYIRFRQELQKIDTDRAGFLLDLYRVFPQEYVMQIKALEDELAFRKTALGKQL